MLLVLIIFLQGRGGNICVILYISRNVRAIVFMIRDSV